MEIGGSFIAMKDQMNPFRTLIVDDSEDECALLELEMRSLRSLKLLGFVHDGAQAIDYLRGIGKFADRDAFPYPDLLLLDVNMPWGDGIDVLRFLQQQPQRPRVILWSAHLQCINVALALRLGVDVVCRKPANKREFEEIIQRLEAKAINPVPSSPPVQSARVEL